MSVTMHPGWSARIELTVPAAEKVVEAVDALVIECNADNGGFDGDRVQLTLTIDAPTFDRALTTARARLPELPRGWELASMEVVRYDLLDNGGEAGLPKLVGLHEAAEILGISAARARALVRTANFPPPVFDFKSGPVYLAADIHRFAAMPRHPGRPLDDPEFMFPVDPDLRGTTAAMTA